MLACPRERAGEDDLGWGGAAFAQPFGLTLNGVKKHVQVLEDADLMLTEKVGRARECRLGPAQLHDVVRWIEEYRQAWQERLDRFGANVEQSQGGDR